MRKCDLGKRDCELESNQRGNKTWIVGENIMEEAEKNEE